MMLESQCARFAITNAKRMCWSGDRPADEQVLPILRFCEEYDEYPSLFVSCAGNSRLASHIKCPFRFAAPSLSGTERLFFVAQRAVLSYAGWFQRANQATCRKQCLQHHFIATCCPDFHCCTIRRGSTIIGAHPETAVWQFEWSPALLIFQGVRALRHTSSVEAGERGRGGGRRRRESVQLAPANTSVIA